VQDGCQGVGNGAAIVNSSELTDIQCPVDGVELLVHVMESARYVTPSVPRCPNVARDRVEVAALADQSANLGPQVTNKLLDFRTQLCPLREVDLHVAEIYSDVAHKPDKTSVLHHQHRTKMTCDPLREKFVHVFLLFSSEAACDPLLLRTSCFREGNGQVSGGADFDCCLRHKEFLHVCFMMALHVGENLVACRAERDINLALCTEGKSRMFVLEVVVGKMPELRLRRQLDELPHLFSALMSHGEQSQVCCAV